MNKKIEAGALGDTANFFKKLGSILLKGLDSLVEIGLQIDTDTKKELTSEKWPKKMRFKTTKGEVIEVYAELTDDTGKKCNLEIKRQGAGSPIKRKNIPTDQIIEEMKANIARFGLGDMEDVEDVKSSRRVDVTLQRVCSSEGDSINLVAINATYAACEALKDLDAVLSDDDFVSEITEEPQSFSILDQEDTLQVGPCNSADVAVDGLLTMLKSAAMMERFLQYIHWNARGDKMMDLHNHAETSIWTCRDEIDFLAELHVEMFGRVPNLDSIVAHADPLNEFSDDEGYDMMQACLENHINELECYVVNLPQDAQIRVEGYIREYKKTSRYFIARIRAN